MHFRLHPLRFSFRAVESIHFPPGQSSNILRGAFGTIFRRIACAPSCQGARTCEHRASCAYARFFEPAALMPGPSGLADSPRPFVFRAAHLDGLTIAREAPFHFDLNLFETQTPAIAALSLAFAQLAQEGLGPDRKRVELTDVSQLNEQGAPGSSEKNPPPLELSLDSPNSSLSYLRVQFLTPTELKSGQQLAARPEFGILAARARDRISTLCGLYGDGALDIDFPAFGERAARVQMTRCEITTIDQSRHSSRTGQTHPIGGFIGEAEYQGDLTEFVPYLYVAQWTGIGRQTVWGKGSIRIVTQP